MTQGKKRCPWCGHPMKVQYLPIFHAWYPTHDTGENTFCPVSVFRGFETEELALKALAPLAEVQWPTEPLSVYDEEIKEAVMPLCDRDRLNFIAECVVDYDGYRTAQSLAGLLNEVYCIAKAPRRFNRAMTKEEIATLDDKEPVWSVYLPCGTVTLWEAGQIKTFIQRHEGVDNYAFFDFQPLDTDIELVQMMKLRLADQNQAGGGQ